MSIDEEKRADDELKGGRKGQWWRRPDDELVSERIQHLKDVFQGRTNGEGQSPEEFERELRNDPRVKNLLDMVVHRRKGMKREDCFLMVPVYSSSRGRSIAKALKLKTYRRIRFDEYGWAVWSLCDGRRDVESIGEGLRAKFGAKVEPLYPRLSKFLAYLRHLDLVTIRERKGPKPRSD